MFLKIKFQNFFVLTFIIILFWVTPLYFVKANKLVVPSSNKNPFSLTINSELANNKLLPLPQVKLTFELCHTSGTKETSEGNSYTYKLIFEDKEKTSKDLLLFCHLNTSIFSNNDVLTDLFDIKCYYKGETDKVFVEFKDSNPKDSQFKDYKLEFSNSIDLKKWEYDIKIEIKTKSEKSEEYKKYENKEIKLKCELDIIDKDNYPVYLFNLFEQFQNQFQNSNTFFPNFLRTNFDFYKENDNSLNPIWLVYKKNNKFVIYDLIMNKEIPYNEYQDLAKLYHDSSYNEKMLIEKTEYLYSKFLKSHNEYRENLKKENKNKTEENRKKTEESKKKMFKCSEDYYEFCIEYEEFKEKNAILNKNLIMTNNVSRIKLYFRKDIYNIDDPNTHSSLHLKKDWDIGEIKYDGGATDGTFDKFIIKTRQKIERKDIQNYPKTPDRIELTKTEFLEKQQGLMRYGQQLYSSKEGCEAIYQFNKESMNMLDEDYRKYLEKNYTSIGNKKTKTLQDMQKTRYDYNKRKINVVSMPILPTVNYSLLKISNKDNLNPINSG